MALHVKVNFANFIALPITFGIGVDYAVNIVARWQQLRFSVSSDEPLRREHVIEAIRSTGGAVGLASMTTIIGYSSLLLAENRALFSFGILAVLGEVCCITTAVVALPAVVILFARKDAAAVDAKPSASNEPETT